MNVTDWKTRLDEMDHSKGTTNRMIQTAMKAEIMALRKALRKQTARAERASQRAKEWRAHANRFQKLAAERKEDDHERKRISAAPIQREPGGVRQEVGRDFQTRWAGGRSPFDV